MAENLRMAYDKEGDVLDISLGTPVAAISREIEDDLFVRVNPETNEIIGLSILNFEKWFQGKKDVRTLPVAGSLNLAEKVA